jgi:microcompartment protein CcmL/EutN
MSNTNHNALGLVETFGLVFVLEAADAMVKAAEVDLIGYENTASGYISVLVGGDVAACKTAVDAGVKAVLDMGGNLYSHVVIARPHPDLRKIIERYTLDKLLPYGVEPDLVTEPQKPSTEDKAADPAQAATAGADSANQTGKKKK